MGTAGRTTPEGDRAFLQERLTFFAKWVFLIWGTLVAALVVMYSVFPSTAPRRLTTLYPFTVSALAILGLLWVGVLERRSLSRAVLRWIDVLYVLLIGADFGLTTYLSSDKGANVYSAFVWCVFLLFARALIVPGSGRRTALVSTVALVPVMVAGIAVAALHPSDLGVPIPAFVTGVVIFSATAVALATIATLTAGSRVIFRLRKQVREAQQLGQYTLVEKIGEGGMGAVYRARHALLRRPTAIKLLPPERLGEDSVRRFEREVQLTSELTHPNTIEIYDYGRSPDGVFYYVMEYLDGIDLERLIKLYGAQPAGRVVHVLAQVSAALGEAHRRGMIHRDVKPGNIILCTRGDVPDVAKVVDFGLVKELDRGETESNIAVVSGTPAYLAPESITNPDRVAPSSDLYALGAVGYYMLTGERVFEGRTSVEVCAQHVTAEPVPPSRRCEHPIPGDLEEVILRCLAKDPGERPASADELAEALLALRCAGEWTGADGRSWWRELRERQAVDGPEGAEGAEPGPAGQMTITVDIGAR